jgi:hypothetical protein
VPKEKIARKAVKKYTLLHCLSSFTLPLSLMLSLSCNSTGLSHSLKALHAHSPLIAIIFSIRCFRFKDGGQAFGWLMDVVGRSAGGR